MSTSYKTLAIFGDSLSDTGNLYRLSCGKFPAFPYYQGRFCNGPIWVDYLQKHFPNATCHNYAIGGSGAVLNGHPSLPYSFAIEEHLIKEHFSS